MMLGLIGSSRASCRLWSPGSTQCSYPSYGPPTKATVAGAYMIATSSPQASSAAGVERRGGRADDKPIVAVRGEREQTAFQFGAAGALLDTSAGPPENPRA